MSYEMPFRLTEEMLQNPRLLVELLNKLISELYKSKEDKKETA